ncbi:alpha/beta fold hydrolase [Corallococcus sp. CA047B]|uniref:alpha/beta fold hydrolase n=1 Tax=Corallococcus sp. CA047B TaxID=2316729 RepID=UPI000EA1C8E3|nr:alpha/beta fold hydrolase [Corallococcus sp. CA047B]RKH20645.1 alpha/beta fold hydrolase [Corallococcus sp. CA047B]
MRIESIQPLLRILALVLVTTAAHAAGAGSPRAGEIITEVGSTKTAQGETVQYELGTLFVPENRAVANSRLIGVGFARIKAARPTGAPPIFILPGGPARSYLNAFTDEDAAAKKQLAGVFPFTAAGDVVVMDQRGYSKRGEELLVARPRQPLDRPRTLAADAAELVKLARDAIAAHPDKDLAGYTIVQCAEDVNDLRRALGYEQLTLSGQSFGSQWSFAVMKLHPEIVARAWLSGVEPLDNAFDMPSHVFTVLQRIAWDADRAPELAPWLPRGGVMEALRAVHARLASGPLRVKVKDAATGKARTVVLGLEDFRASLLMPPEAWPAFVLSLYHRHYDDWARAVLQERQAEGSPVRLIAPLIDSSLGVSAQRAHLLRTDSGTEALGMTDFDALIASADAWPTPPMEDSLRLPVPSPIPVLFFHGDWDTSTPIDNTLGMLPYFPNGRALLVHRGVHHTRAPVFEQHPEILPRVIAFLKTGDTRDFPVNVSLPVPTFQKPSFTPGR